MHIRECLSKYNHYVTEEETHKLFQEDMATYRDVSSSFLSLCLSNSPTISVIFPRWFLARFAIMIVFLPMECMLNSFSPCCRSDRILEAFKDAKYENKKNFRVIIIDSRPRNASEEMAKKCLENNIRTTFIPLNALPYIMNVSLPSFLLSPRRWPSALCLPVPCTAMDRLWRLLEEYSFFLLLILLVPHCSYLQSAQYSLPCCLRNLQGMTLSPCLISLVCKWNLFG